ncbi:tetratricopeptide repeat protein [Echinimonas agarilytica]|uniref:Tetratricopeptide repeat-containing protein n=1 Tax=Echinimonas agarilytica TaxID=1215918 RepID=A0AA41W6J7_9GAMM|nr:hypothetical protein [Echinimonas agarilytica]MCM2679827.1 hypothetical protein [Echinimonas agarilytica]
MKRQKILLTGILCACVTLSSQFVASAAFAAEPTAAPKTVDQALAVKYKGHKTKVASPKVGKKVIEAFDLYSEDKPKEAIQVLKDINTKKDFDKAYVDRLIGSILAGEDGQVKEAMKYLKSAVALNVLNPKEQAEGIRIVGDLQMQEKQYKDAIASYKSWMDYTSFQDKTIYVRMAQANYEIGKYAAMIPLADKAIQLSDKPDKNPYILKLSSYYERKQYKNSVKVLEELVRLFPEDEKWWAQLGMFYMLIDDYDKALATMSLAYKKNLFTKESQFKALAQLYYNNSVPYKAAKIVEKHIAKGDLKSDDKMVTLMANAYRSAKEFDKAAKYYGEAARLKNDGELYRKQASMYLMLEQYNSAIKAAKNALKVGLKKKGSANMMIAEAHLYQKNLKDAHKYAVRAAKDPTTRKMAEGWSGYIATKAQQKGIAL